MALQVSCAARRVSTESLGNQVSISTVVSAMNNGVEWGNGYTRSSPRTSPFRGDENTHRIEVTVTDDTSSDVLGVFSSSQHPGGRARDQRAHELDINTVIYNRERPRGQERQDPEDAALGLPCRRARSRAWMTFVWTKTSTAQGVRFNCSITGVDAATEKQLRGSITNGVLDQVFGLSADDKSDSAPRPRSPPRWATRQTTRQARRVARAPPA